MKPLKKNGWHFKSNQAFTRSEVTKLNWSIQFCPEILQNNFLHHLFIYLYPRLSFYHYFFFFYVSFQSTPPPASTQEETWKLNSYPNPDPHLFQHLKHYFAQTTPYHLANILPHSHPVLYQISITLVLGQSDWLNLFTFIKGGLGRWQSHCISRGRG